MPASSAIAASIARRSLVPERMDDPALDPVEHERALRGLMRINGFSRTAGQVWRAIRRLAPAPADAPLRLADIACGGGDVTVGVAQRARRAGVAAEVSGLDISPTALACARRLSERAAAPASFARLDVLREPLPAGFDVLFSCLFLHHLDEADAVTLLKRMAGAAGRGIVICDLVRSGLGLWAARVGTRLLSRSPVVHFDGPQSVRAAWTSDEVASLAERAGLAGCRIRRCFPQRFLLTWRRT